METLIFERRGPVGWLRLNRPDRLNAQVPQMWRELAELGGELQKDSELRALVVTGVGRSFSSGIDVSQFSADPLFQQPGSGTAQPNGRDPFLDAIARFQEGFLILAELAVPTIAAVRGHALGAGFQLALACDLRIVARGTKLGMLEHRYGLVPDLGGTVWLPRLVGPAKAKELIWTAATFDAEEADRLGLVNRLVDDDDLDEATADLAGVLAAAPPLAVAASKRLVDAVTEGTTTAEGLAAAGEAQAGCIRSADFTEAIAAFTEKRAPVYTGR